MERTNIERAVLIAGAAATFSFAELLETQAAELSTPQESAQVSPFETLLASENIGIKAQFLEIPAFNVTDPSTDAEQVNAQDILSSWVKITEQAASDSGFLPTDFEATVKGVVQNGKTYNVSETSLVKDVEVSIQDQTTTLKKNSLLVPYITNNGLAIAVMSDTDGEGTETTVGSYIATIGDKSIAIPARFDMDHNPVSFMQFVVDANGEVQPQEIEVSQAIINSDQTNVRDVQDPSIVIGKMDKGTEITLVGTDADAKPVNGKNFQVLLAVTPEGKTFKIATSLVKRIERKASPIIETTSNDTAVIPGLGMGEQDIFDPNVVNAIEKSGAFSTYWDLLKANNNLEGVRVFNTIVDGSVVLKTVNYNGFTGNYITLQVPRINPESGELENRPIDLILTIYDSTEDNCSMPTQIVGQLKDGIVVKGGQVNLYQMTSSVFTPGREVSVLSLPTRTRWCGQLPEVVNDWQSITSSDHEAVLLSMAAVKAS